jgi:hypothetical protein
MCLEEVLGMELMEFLWEERSEEAFIWWRKNWWWGWWRWSWL